MRPAQGQTAILEGKDDVLPVLIAPENMRSEAHSELHMGSAQTGAIVDGLLNDGRTCQVSFPRRLLGHAGVLHLPTPEATIASDGIALITCPCANDCKLRAILVSSVPEI
jgi:hypothetical protein